MEVKGFDEKAQEALTYLFEHFWILRRDEPSLYQRVREREHQLKRYVIDKFGFDLIVHQHFIKLEKIPVEPKSWMGIQSFTSPMDYAIFCCGLAFTENRAVEDQFLLSDFCEDIEDLYPGDFALDWTNFNHRKSLVRAMKVLVEIGVLKKVDGEIDGFTSDEDHEVLYEVTVYGRYFMRSYPEDLFKYETPEQILESEWGRHAEDIRRKRVYRKLLFSPVVHRQSEDDPDFAYIRNFRNRLSDDLEEHTPYRLEVFKNAAMLVMEENKLQHTLFPNQKGISNILLHFSALVRTKELKTNALGQVSLTRVEYNQLLEELQEEYGHGWSKAYREGTIKKTGDELLAVMEEWELGYLDRDVNMVILNPALGRVTGYYPQDYMKKRSAEHAENE